MRRCPAQASCSAHVAVDRAMDALARRPAVQRVRQSTDDVGAARRDRCRPSPAAARTCASHRSGRRRPRDRRAGTSATGVVRREGDRPGAQQVRQPVACRATRASRAGSRAGAAASASGSTGSATSGARRARGAEDAIGVAVARSRPRSSASAATPGGVRPRRSAPGDVGRRPRAGCARASSTVGLEHPGRLTIVSRVPTPPSAMAPAATGSASRRRRGRTRRSGRRPVTTTGMPQAIASSTGIAKPSPR